MRNYVYRLATTTFRLVDPLSLPPEYYGDDSSAKVDPATPPEYYGGDHCWFLILFIPYYTSLLKIKTYSNIVFFSIKRPFKKNLPGGVKVTSYIRI